MCHDLTSQHDGHDDTMVTMDPQAVFVFIESSCSS